MSFAPHCGHFLLYKRFSERLWEKIKRNQRKQYREKIVNEKEKTSGKITTLFHLKEINMKNVIYISAYNKRFFMK